MNRNEEILTILAEECAEVVQQCMKIKRFGLSGNEEKLAHELGDLQCMIDLIYEYKLLTTPIGDRLDNVFKKRQKLKTYSSIFNET